MGASGVDKRKRRNQWLDLPLPEKLEQGEQILTKQGRSDPLQPLNAVRDDALASGKNPATGDVQTDDGDWTNTVTAAATVRPSLSLD